MRKQDRQGVRKASDIEQKYDLSQLKNSGTKSEDVSKLTQALSQYAAETNGKIKDIQEQVEELQEQAEGFAPAYDKLGVGLKIEDKTLYVDSAQDFEGDNTRPVEAAFVQSQIGNIELLLKTI